MNGTKQQLRSARRSRSGRSAACQSSRSQLGNKCRGTRSPTQGVAKGRDYNRGMRFSSTDLGRTRFMREKWDSRLSRNELESGWSIVVVCRTGKVGGRNLLTAFAPDASARLHALRRRGNGLRHHALTNHWGITETPGYRTSPRQRRQH